MSFKAPQGTLRPCDVVALGGLQTGRLTGAQYKAGLSNCQGCLQPQNRVGSPLQSI